jgi:hypothetical protein
MYMQRADLQGKHKHHLNATNLDNLSTCEGPVVAWLDWGSIDFDAVPALDLQYPPLFLGIEEYHCMHAGDHLARAEINVYEVLVIFIVGLGRRRIRRAANVHAELCDVEGPVLRRNLCVGLDAVLGLMDGIGMVFAGLDGVILGVQELLSDLRYQVVIFSSIEPRLVCRQERLVFLGDISGRGLVLGLRGWTSRVSNDRK